MAYVSKLERLFSTVGVLLHVLFVALPKDFWRWTHLTRKSVRGKTVVITGGASGIGRGIAELFAIQHQANVAILDIDTHGALETVQRINQQGGIAHSWTCDISRVEDLERCAADIINTFGEVEIVICNAAILFFGSALELTFSQLQKSVNVNILGTMNTIRAFLRPMEERNRGHVVAVSSIAGFYGETNGMAYCPSKFAVRGIMECLQMEMYDRGLDGIRFTTVCPYFTRTPMILNMGMRPTSIWIPFMSVGRCSREIVDAILKEKIIAFIPNYITIIASMKCLMSKYVQIAGREYLNCRYEPTSKSSSSDDSQAIVLSKASDFFEEPHFAYKILLPTLSLLTAVSFVMSGWLPQTLFLTTLLTTIAAHTAAAIYSLYLCDAFSFSHSCTCRWFYQTLISGFASLFLLIRHKHRVQ